VKHGGKEKKRGGGKKGKKQYEGRGHFLPTTQLQGKEKEGTPLKRSTLLRASKEKEGGGKKKNGDFEEKERKGGKRLISCPYQLCWPGK